ncbi:uncharacterized protein LOC110736656 [Chenopodium quinoa]|uniref:uncharacterized protein LOC110736656 n=1 Tax=Chenopodium quinoa TaxID=63459 RepID=UPI000B77CD02|nr:uncharacterized protein LOC110736656 [Chenopodium quinoa]
MLRKNLYVKATIGIGISGDYHDDEGLNGVVDGMINGRGDSNRIVAEQHEHWLHNSVTEIVKNVGEAPLLVHIYTENGPKKTSKLSSSSTTNVKFVIEKRRRLIVGQRSNIGGRTVVIVLFLMVLSWLKNLSLKLPNKNIKTNFGARILLQLVIVIIFIRIILMRDQLWYLLLLQQDCGVYLFKAKGSIFILVTF